MADKLPIKYKEGIFSRIKKFFSGLLKKDSIVIEKYEEEKVEVVHKEDEFEKMRVASNKVKIKDDILSMIEKNPELIETLSIDKLIELDHMYDQIIEANDRKIKRLKREIS